MSVYEMITKRIVEKLEQGVIPWKKPWSSPEHAPKNLISLKKYKGINSFLTATQNYASPFWLTYKQASSLGGNIKQGEKGTPVIYWNFGEKEELNADGEKEKYGFLKYYTVFNFDQTEGIKLNPKLIHPDLVRSETEKIESCEKVIQGFKNIPKLESIDQARAYYRPSTDTINMPEQKRFHSDQEYYSTLFHELTHSTGHGSRLARKGVVDVNFFGSHDYSFEELVAEFGAAFLCGHTGIMSRTLDNSASYIQGWLKVLRKDSKLLITAAGQAQKAASLILGEEQAGA